jgi:hypothetical protein
MTVGNVCLIPEVVLCRNHSVSVANFSIYNAVNCLSTKRDIDVRFFLPLVIGIVQRILRGVNTKLK